MAAIIIVAPDVLRLNPDEVTHIEINDKGDVKTVSTPEMYIITKQNGYASGTCISNGEPYRIDMAPAIVKSARELNIPIKRVRKFTK